MYLFTFAIFGSMLAEGIVFILGEAIWKVNLFSPDGHATVSEESLITFNRINMLLGILLTFILPATIFRRLMEFEGQDYLNVRKSVSAKYVIYLFGFFIATFVVTNFLFYVNKMLDPVSLHFKDGEAINAFENESAKLQVDYLFSNDIWIYVVNLVSFGILTAVGEEFFFRSIMLRLILKITRRVHLAVFIGGLVFSLAHFSYYGFIPRLFLGMLLGYIYLYTANIWYCILFHLLNNGVAVTLYYFMANNYKVEYLDQIGFYGWTRWLGLAILSITMLVFFYKHHRWSNNTFLEEIADY